MFFPKGANLVSFLRLYLPLLFQIKPILFDDIIKKLADWQEIPEPPKPKGQAPKLPQDFFDKSLEWE